MRPVPVFGPVVSLDGVAQHGHSIGPFGRPWWKQVPVSPRCHDTYTVEVPTQDLAPFLPPRSLRGLIGWLRDRTPYTLPRVVTARGQYETEYNRQVSFKRCDGKVVTGVVGTIEKLLENEDRRSPLASPMLRAGQVWLLEVEYVGSTVAVLDVKMDEYDTSLTALGATVPPPIPEYVEPVARTPRGRAKPLLKAVETLHRAAYEKSLYEYAEKYEAKALQYVLLGRTFSFAEVNKLLIKQEGGCRSYLISDPLGYAWSPTETNF